jgi:hypothetical protein
VLPRLTKLSTLVLIIWIQLKVSSGLVRFVSGRRLISDPALGLPTTVYRNEEEVGQAIKESGLSRKELWVTTKWSGVDGKGPKQSCKESLEKVRDVNIVYHLLPIADVTGYTARLGPR